VSHTNHVALAQACASRNSGGVIGALREFVEQRPSRSPIGPAPLVDGVGADLERPEAVIDLSR